MGGAAEHGAQHVFDACLYPCLRTRPHHTCETAMKSTGDASTACSAGANGYRSIYSRFSTGYSHGTIAQRYSLQSRHAAYGTACSMHCSTLSGMQHAACSVQHGVPSHTAGTMQCITPRAACGTCYIVQHAACGAYSVACSMQHIMQCDMQQAPRSTARSMLHRTQRTQHTPQQAVRHAACSMQHVARSK